MDAIIERLSAASGPNASLEQRVSLCQLMALVCRGISVAELERAMQQCGGHGTTAVTVAAMALAQVTANPVCYSDRQLWSFVESALLPAVPKATDSSRLQLLSATCMLLCNSGSWELATNLVEAAAAALATQGGSEPVVAAQEAQATAWQLPTPSSACLIAKLVATAAAAATTDDTCSSIHTNNSGGITTEPLSSSEAARVLHAAAGRPLLPATLSCLCSPDAARRSAALQQLLPSVLLAARTLGPDAMRGALSALWARCSEALQQPGVPRRMALAALLQHADCWKVAAPAGAGLDDGGVGNRSQTPSASGGRERGGGEAAAVAASAAAASGGVAHAAGAAAALAGSGGEAAATSGAAQAADAHTSMLCQWVSVPEAEPFWALLRSCLADEEPLNRKRALRLLQALLPGDVATRQPAWAVWLGVLESLEEFTPHLQAATWHMVRAVCVAVALWLAGGCKTCMAFHSFQAGLGYDIVLDRFLLPALSVGGRKHLSV